MSPADTVANQRGKMLYPCYEHVSVVFTILTYAEDDDATCISIKPTRRERLFFNGITLTDHELSAVGLLKGDPHINEVVAVTEPRIKFENNNLPFKVYVC